MHEMYRSDAVTLAVFNPALAGAGLKREHAQAIFSGVRAADFFEVHAENYMGDGGPPHRLLADRRTQAGAVCVDRRTGCVVAVPT